MEFLVAPTVLFMVIVAPIWLVMHYRYKREQAKGISMDELHELETMLEQVDKLADRVATLEKILNEKHPNWRTEK